MRQCSNCPSYAVNPGIGRPKLLRPDLCDVCFWKNWATLEFVLIRLEASLLKRSRAVSVVVHGYALKPCIIDPLKNETSGVLLDTLKIDVADLGIHSRSSLTHKESKLKITKAINGIAGNYLIDVFKQRRRDSRSVISPYCADVVQCYYDNKNIGAFISENTNG